MSAPRFLRMALWSVIGFSGVFMPIYVVGGMIWRRILGVSSELSPSAFHLLGAIAVLYLSLWPTLVLSAILYSPLITLLSYRFDGGRLLLLSTIVASIVPILTILLHVDLSMIGDWPAAAVATIVFGLFCGHILWSRVVPRDSAARE